MGSASATEEPSKTRSGLIEMAAAILVTAILLGLFWPVVLDIWRYSFDDGTYSHAFLIPLVAVYVLYDCRKQLQFRQSSSIWLALLIICLALELLFYLAQFSLPTRALLPFILLFSLLSIFKHRFSLYVYSLVMIFATPIWGVLSPPLQHLSTNMVELVMSYTHVPSYFEGNVVSIPSGQFEIANGCSGLRYFITSLFLCLLYIYFNIRNLKKAILFLVVGLAGALVVNWIRIIVIILIGHETQMQSELIYDHNDLGWYLYIPYLVLAFYLGAKLSDAPTTSKLSSVAPSSSPTPRNVAFVLLALVIFSPSMIDWPNLDADKLNQPPAQLTSQIHPTLLVDKYQSLEQQQLQTEELQLQLWLYRFSGLGLDNKASYYLNEVVPESLHVNKTMVEENINYVYFRASSNRPALLAYAYANSAGLAANRSQLKNQRFIEVLRGQRKSAILAGSSLCLEQDCQAAKNALTEQLQRYASSPSLLQDPS
ncbi:exosortase [Agarivorans sp.]|uniref:exosortase n=1 Tax=Agarivorans sp. TaxID=1872412 RepID=UPI003CFCA1ED